MPTRVYLCPRTWQIVDVVPANGEVYFTTQDAATTTLWRAPYGFPPHAVAQLERTHLLSVDEDGLICLEHDGTLIVRDRNGTNRRVVRVLHPPATAIVVTPEHVVWCAAGVVWRWWRHGHVVEKLGECGAAAPHLVVRPIPTPYPPHRFAADIAIAAGNRIGLVDAEGLEWLADAASVVEHVACTTDAIFWIVGTRLEQCALATEHCSLAAEIDGPAMSLVAHGDHVHLATNCRHVVLDEEVVSAPPARVTVIAAARIDVVELEDATWVREAMRLVSGERGVYLVERGDGHDRLTYIAEDDEPTNRDMRLVLERWLPDGRGGQVTLAHGAWRAHGASGDVPASITAAVNAWLQDNHLNAERDDQFPGGHGWQASSGSNVWFAVTNDRVSVNAVALAALVKLLAKHIAPVRLLMKLA